MAGDEEGATNLHLSLRETKQDKCLIPENNEQTVVIRYLVALELRQCTYHDLYLKSWVTSSF